MSKRTPSSKRLPVISTLFIVLIVSVLLGGYAYYRREAQEIRQRHYVTLKALAHLKADQIGQWKKERIANAHVLAKSPLFSRFIEQWRRNPNDLAMRGDLGKRMNLLKEQGGYENVLIVDLNDSVLYSIDPRALHLDPSSKALVANALSDNSVILGDLYRCSICGRIHIDTAAPIPLSKGRFSTAVILRSDPENYLFPVIQSWPTPSPSAENLLVGKDGDGVLFLNRLRHKNDPPLSLRFSLSRTDIPAVQAVLGKTGRFEGTDYRGVPVLAELIPVPGSPWFMVAKVDIKEIDSEARYRAAVITAIAGLLILLAGTAIAFFYSRLESSAIAESEERFRTTLYSIGDAVITTDTLGRVRQMNPVAEILTGWSEAEALNKPLEQVFRIINEETQIDTENPVARILREGKITGLANHTLLIAADGTKRPIADSGSPVRNKSGAITGVVLVFRDQTEERQVKRLTEMQLSLAFYAASHTLDELLTKALDEIGVLIDSPIGFYHFVEVDQKTLSLQQWSARTLMEFCRAEAKGMHYAIDQAGVWTDCVREKKPVIHNDYASLPHKKGMPKGHAKVIRELTVPVMREGKVVAILGVGNKPEEYTEKDAQIASYLADATWDIVLHKRTTETLAEPEKRWKTILVSTPQIGIALDTQAKIVFANDYFLKLTGWQAQEVLGQNWFDLFIPQKIREEIRHVFHTVMNAKDTLGYSVYENDIVTRNGEMRHVAWSNVISKDAHGNIVDVTCLGIDITERKRSEEALHKSEKKYRELFDSITDLIYTQDMDGRFLSVNPAMHVLFGYDMDEFIGRSASDFMSPELRPLFASEYLEGLKKQGHSEGISSYFKKDGGKIYIEYRSKLVQPEHDKPYISGIGRNVTERVLAEKVHKHSEEEKERLQAQLIQSQKMESVGRLAGGVAHDFNNMLGVILGHAEMAMEKAGASDPIQADLEEIRKAAKRSADLTRHLLAFARKEIIRPQVLDLNDTVSGMLRMLRRLIGEDIHLAWMPGADLWPVKIDPAQIDQILANLCVNARDAITGVGKVTIETQNITLDEEYCTKHTDFVPGTYVMLAVSDDGCGMDKETLEHLFEPFFTTKEVGKGTGLGLATVYGIVKQNEGFVNVYSELNQGTTFKLYFPKTVELVGIKPESIVKTPAKGTETVLLVEDEESILTLGKAILERFGYTVLASRTPKDAITITRRHEGPIHLLVTDVVMPEMNGKELKERIQKLKPQIKVLYMSGYTANVILHRGILEKDVHFLQKPFSVNSLADKVREVLDQQK